MPVGVTPYNPLRTTSDASEYYIGPDGKTYQRPKKNTADPLTRQYQLAEEATKQSAEDYSWISDAYKSMFGLAGSPSQEEEYRPSADYTSAFSDLKNLSRTGGFSDEDISNIRARGISPIRAAYAGANRDIDRQKVLQGGYSPNYAAVKAKMAREQGSLMSDKMTDVNAGIAEMIARNKLNVTPQLLNAATNQSNLENEMRTSKVRNREAAQRAALQGATSLYGTTPALTSTFGNQALNAAQLQNQISQQNQNRDVDVLDRMTSALPPTSAASRFRNPSPIRSIYGR